MTVDVAVIGGGISGLFAAYELVRRGHRVAVLERQVRAGGNAISERLGGFLMEHGPSSVNAASPVADDLSRRVGIDALRCELGSGVRYRYLVRAGTLYRIPIHPFGFLASPYLTIGGRLRMMAEPLVPPLRIDAGETVAAFWRRRFGSEFSDRVIDPLVGGLFAGRAAELSMAATFPAVLDMEQRFGSVIRGAIRSRRAGGRMPGRRLFSWRDGVGTLPQAIVRELGCAVRTGIAVRRITRLAGSFRVEAANSAALHARVVVIATQPHVAAALLDGIDGPGAEAAGAIDAPPLAVTFLGYARRQVDHPLDGLGYLTPSAERRALSGALFCSTMFAARAPEEHVALVGYGGGARAPDLALRTSAELIAIAREEFSDLLGARGDPVVARVRRWPRGLPQYRSGHERHVAALRDVERRCAGLFVTGNYFAGVSVAACLTQALATASRVHGVLRGDREDLDRTAPTHPSSSAARCSIA